MAHIRDMLQRCCDTPNITLEDMTIPSPSPYIQAEWDCRLKCRSCGLTTPWCAEYEHAKDHWNKSIQSRNAEKTND